MFFKKWCWIAFVVIASGFIVSIFSRRLSQIEEECKHVQKCDWAASNLWLESAKCMKNRGIWLAFEEFDGESLESSRVIPLEERDVADDLGHAFLLGWISKLLDREMKPADIARLNIYINLIGLLGIVCYFLAIRNYFILIVFIALSNLIFFRKIDYAPHTAYIGVSSLLFLLPLGLLAYHYRWLSRKFSCFFIVAGVLALSLAALVRGVLGHMGLLINFGTFAL